MSISPSTVDHHVRHIYDKPGVQSRAGATPMASIVSNTAPIGAVAVGPDFGGRPDLDRVHWRRVTTSSPGAALLGATLGQKELGSDVEVGRHDLRR
jgi:hypothetical protein